jgi:thymidylate synthase (FAD)
MEVKLVSSTLPIPIQGVNALLSGSIPMSPEQLIVYIARVSNPGNQNNTETSPKLIKYLIENKHWSPFEMVDFTVEIKTSRAIAQQILRHRSFSFQEFSQRYAKVSEFEPIELRKQTEKNRQSSSEVFDPTILYYYNDEDFGKYKLSELVKEHTKNSDALYNRLIEEGVAKESARFILPLSTSTTIYMKGSVRSWIHYLQIRCDEHTQKEHREIALEIKDIFVSLLPSVSEALNFKINNDEKNN